MLNDIIGISEEELNHLLDNFNDAVVFNGKHWRHKALVRDHMVYFTSTKIDKYFAEILKKYVKYQKPATGAFASKTTKQLIAPHITNSYVLVSDVKHYFESIGYEHVEQTILNIPEAAIHADIIKKLYFGKEGKLRRGLIASPIISEIVGLKIDQIINKTMYDDKMSKSYARYYDDIFIFNQEKNGLHALLKSIEKNLAIEVGLELNHKKTKIVHTNGAELLGLRIHDGNIRVSKKFLKQLRAMDNGYKNTQVDIYDLQSLYDAKSFAGSIVGTLRHVMNNSDGLPNAKRYLEMHTEYWDEIERIEGSINELKAQMIENGELEL